MTRAEHAVLAASRARDLCVALRRAAVGPTALARLRSGEAATLLPAELRIALGLAWAAGELTLVRASVAGLPRDRVEADPVLATLRDATRRAGSGSPE